MIQPEWRRAAQDLPQSPTAWSYILSGGSKGAFLVVMCLAWWDRAHARYVKETKKARLIKAEDTGVTANFDDLPDHDPKWLEVVSDVVLVMENAQDSEIPAQGMPSPSRRTKRKREPEPAAPRKRSVVRTASSRTRTKA